MKTRLNLSLDRETAERAKRWARVQGTTVSAVVQEHLASLTGRPEGSFSERWRGRFALRSGEDPRGQYLRKRYDLNDSK